MKGLIPRLLAAVVLLTVTVASQTPARDTRTDIRSGDAAIVGAVTLAGDPSIPLRRARVILESDGQGSRIVNTDTNGRFLFDAIPSGLYRIRAEKGGFVTPASAAGLPEPPGEIRVAAAQTITASLGLTRGAAIEGILRNALGEPVPGATVHAERSDDATAVLQKAVTDDLGRYRIHSLPAGAYRLRAVAGRLPAQFATTQTVYKPYRPTFYPATPEASEAQIVHVAGAQEISSADLTMVYQSPYDDVDLAALASPCVRSTSGGTTVAGRVTSEATGAPVRGATVKLISYETAVRPQPKQTDRGGCFEFDRVPAGRYYLSAGGSMLVTKKYGQRNPGDPPTPIEVRTGDRLEGMNVVLPAPGAVEGVALDEFGDPVPDLIVNAAMVETMVGGPRLLQPIMAWSDPRPTDDKGRFRIAVATPGPYYIAARGGAVTTPDATGGFALTYYPQATAPADAQRVTFEPDREVRDLVIRMQLAEMTRFTGTVVGPNGPIAGGRVVLTPRQRGDEPTPWATLAIAQTDTGPDGGFSFRNIAPGEYGIQAYGQRSDPKSPASDLFGGIQVIATGTNIEGLVVNVGTARRARGRIVDDAGAPVTAVRVETASVDLDLNPTWQDRQPNTVSADGTFELSNQFGRRLIRVNARNQYGLSSGWNLKRVTLNGRDITDEPVDFSRGDVDGIEIQVTYRTPVVQGVVFARENRTATNYTVVVFSADQREWRNVHSRSIASHQETRLDNGRFRIAGLLPGQYFAVAIPIPELGEPRWFDRLEELQRTATRISLADGAVTETSLRLQLEP